MDITSPSSWSASVTAPFGSSTNRAWTLRQDSVKRARSPGESGRSLKCSTRFLRSSRLASPCRRSPEPSPRVFTPLLDLVSWATVRVPGHVANRLRDVRTQFNGLSQGAAYGDDVQSATNYPLVQITNNATGHKFFARTHDHSTMAVATGNAITSTQFDILPTSSGTEFGASTLVVIANGIPSKPVGITVSQ